MGTKEQAGAATGEQLSTPGHAQATAVLLARVVLA